MTTRWANRSANDLQLPTETYISDRLVPNHVSHIRPIASSVLPKRAENEGKIPKQKVGFMEGRIRSFRFGCVQET